MSENGRGSSPRDINYKLADWSAKMGSASSLSQVLAFHAFHEQVVEQLVGLRAVVTTGNDSNVTAIILRRCSGT